MRRETLFMLAASLFGMLAAIGTTVILMAIAVPAMTPYLLTFAEKSDGERMAAAAQTFSGPGIQSTIAVIVMLAAIIVLGLFLLVINPQVQKGLQNWRSRAGAKLLIVMVAVIGWLFLAAVAIDSPFHGGTGIGGVVQFFALVIGTGAFWMIAGELGWAGDCSSWSAPRDAQWRRTFLLGSAAGAALFAVFGLIAWSFNKYFVLVSEVLDRSGETSFLGFQLLAIGLVVLFGKGFPLAAGFISALAPVRRDPEDLRRRLTTTLAAFLGLLAALSAAYAYAAIKYDLGQKDLATTLKVKDQAEKERTVVAFLPSRDLPVTVQKWPLQASGAGFTTRHTIALSEENLNKVETYLKAHPNGSVFTYPARELLVNGYFALWDAEQGMKWQINAAESQLIHRQLLLARFSVLPARAANLDLLRSYTDEKAWYAGGRSALLIAAAYRHFGETAEADRWLQKAKARGADRAKADFLNEPVVTTGSVRGRVLLNGKPLAGVKTALIGRGLEPKKAEDYRISETTLSRSLADVQVTGADGRFAFTSLGSGAYVVAVMMEKDVLPVDAKQGAITARNVPGVIQIGSVATRDVGTIEIVTTGK